jgi:hypothetical protein
MGALSAIPVIGWIISLCLSICLSIPFYFLWHTCGIKQFFYFLPDMYVNIGFWQCVGLFITISILKLMLYPSFSATVTNKND